MSQNTICDPDLLPVGLQGFANIIRSHMLYVDKTELIFKIAEQRSPIFFSRSRRFGKSLLVNTLSCLFSKGIEYFHGLAIESMWQDTTYRVVHLDFSGIARAVHDRFRMSFAETLITEFGTNNSVSKVNEFGVREPDRILNDIAKNLDDNSVVLLIDEYDAPLTRHLHEPEILNEMISILDCFYSTIKQYTDKFRFIFITGITRASHVSIFSSFNNLIDLSFQKEFNELLGFTQKDLEQYFDVYVEDTSNIYNISKEDLYQRIKQYYNGYQFSLEANERVYNPWSILNFFKFPQNGFQNYWFDSSGTSSIIMNYLKIKY